MALAPPIRLITGLNRRYSAADAPVVRAGGLVVALAVRLPSFAAVPSLAGRGHPGLAASAWFGLYGSLGIPAAIMARLNTACAMMPPPDTQRQIEALGLRPEGGLLPAEFRAFVASEVGQWRAVLRIAGVTAD